MAVAPPNRNACCSDIAAPPAPSVRGETVAVKTATTSGATEAGPVVDMSMANGQKGSQHQLRR